MALPSIEFVREALAYEPLTGELRWKERPRSHFKTERGYRIFRSRFAGRVAGHVFASTGYRLVNLGDYGHIGVHRLAIAIVAGTWPEVVDHVNGDTLDNRLENLRACTKAQNCMNRKRNRANRSGLKGVSSLPNSSRWQARIQHKGVQIHLGMFDTPELAHAAYVAAARNLHGEFANFG
ncbi:HNH endonuclease [Pandoraea nosoerga]|uniref:HNH endonuclease n=1 Tax=Pandoraea nosoerga TaxID=2508296 RepID=UPI00197FD7B8|nr:HNH endonuclease [Pandoraea nosoerga]MBN4665435.1 HNH endonuclease [Pandoraea nosoerga]MBN4674960.1 HNH endonuclease [Pandoraea nosoerga]MBN4680276.1 HNH endonuclease [Pandoraea nosoerga]MBN4744491.1 HNH endonuclease [Pandoraea nosoerga]